MKKNKLESGRILSAALMLSLFAAQLDCSNIAASSSTSQATPASNATCYDDGIGCGTPELGAVAIGQFNAFPVQTATLLYTKAQQAGLKVDRIGTYWDRFMDDSGNYTPSNIIPGKQVTYLQELKGAVAGDLANGVIPEFLLGTEGSNYMPCIQCPNNSSGLNPYPSRPAANEALSSILANLVATLPNVKYWELFNEMDAGEALFAGTGQSCPMQRGRLYGQMLNVAVPAARRVNPDIHILMGGMVGAYDILDSPSFSSSCGYSSGFDTDLPETMADFLTGIYNVGAGRNFDIVNAHAYADTSYWNGNTTDINIEPRFEAISTSLRRVVLAQKNWNKQFWVTEFGISGAEEVGSETCDANSNLGPCMDQTQVNVLGAVVDDLMQNRLFDVAIIYALPRAGGTIDPSYNQYLPLGMTVNDYGYQILRSDDLTLRPMFSWLIQRNSCLSQGGHMFTTNWICQ
jgi:hypothetical protein